MIKSSVPRDGERSIEEIILFVMLALLGSLFATALFNDM